MSLFVCLFVCLFVRAITHSLIDLESWNFAEILLYLFARNTIILVWRNSDFTTLNPLFNKQCLFFSLFIHTQHLLKPTGLTELRLTKPKDMPKSENRVIQLQPSTQCLLMHLFTYPQHLPKLTDFQE